MHRFFVDPDISVARTLDTSFYHDETVFEACREKLFATSWQFIGTKELASGPGALYPFTLLEKYLDEPLLLSRDKEDKLRLLSNVCTHRGNILVDKACRQSNIRCRYHGRQFGLDGKFMTMPEFREVKDFPSGDDDLKALPIFEWGNWIFASLNPVQSPAVFFDDMARRVSWMPLQDFEYRPDLSREFHVNAHWALYCENYLEGFHIPFVHAGLNAVLDFGNYETELYFPYSSLQIGLAKSPSDSFTLPESSPDYGQHIAAYYFWVFPNMMFNFYPWGLSVNVVEPISTNESKVRFYSYVWDEVKLDKGAGAGLDKVEKEDEEIVENVQKGVRSRFYRHGRYSVSREKGTHHFHRIISSLME